MINFFALDPDSQAERLKSAGHIALRDWGIENAQLELIKYRENAVFKVQEGDFRAALRVHRYGYHTHEELRSELQWMGALARSGIKVPEIIRTKSHDLFVEYDAEGLPGALQIDLFEWIDGKQLGSVEEGVDDESEVSHTFGLIGELAARVHNQAATWCIPKGFTRHAWDAEGLAGERPFWGRFWEIRAATDAQRALLGAVRERLYTDLTNIEKTHDSYSMIHADFAAENIMVDGTEVRLIDFDDAGYGWHLFELVTALFFLQGESYFDSAKNALIDGYRKHRQLSDEQLKLLPLFFMARSTTYVGWVHTRAETETAQELTPTLVEAACELAEEYL